MKTRNTRRRLIALVPLVAIAILLVGNRIVPDQNRAQAANHVSVIIQGGIVVQGGITQGQVIRFKVARLATAIPGPHVIELRVFDSNGIVLASNTYVFPQNQNGDVNGIQSSFFDLNAAQLPAGAFDNTGRAELIGIVKSVDPNNPNKPPNPSCRFVASGEVFDSNTAKTLVH